MVKSAWCVADCCGCVVIASGILAAWEGREAMKSGLTVVLSLHCQLVNRLRWSWLLGVLRVAVLWHSYYHAWQWMDPQDVQAWMRPMELVNTQAFCKIQMKKKISGKTSSDDNNIISKPFPFSRSGVQRPPPWTNSHLAVHGFVSSDLPNAC